MKPGETVRISGLVKAAQHNGKLGRVSTKSGNDGRIGVVLSDGAVLAVRSQNLEVVEEVSTSAAASSMPEGKERTLKRDNALLREFYASAGDPDCLVLYFHLRDQSFDCYNATEYNGQMLRYAGAGISVKEVVPRLLGAEQCFLVCLQNQQAELNTLCTAAFQCQRSFCGISMLVRQRCFACQKPGAPLCACNVACFCSEQCKASEVGRAHQELCELVRACSVALAPEEQSVQLLCGE